MGEALGTTLKYVILVVFLRNFWHREHNKKKHENKKEKQKEERRELFRAAFVFLPNRKLGKCTAKKYAK